MGIENQALRPAGIDARPSFVAPRRVACVGVAQDSRVFILSYTKDDNNLLVPGATPIWPRMGVSTSILRNVILQMSNPVTTSPGAYLPVHNYLLNSPAQKGTLTSLEYYQWNDFRFDLPLHTVYIFRDSSGFVSSQIYRRNQSTNEIEFEVHLRCK